MGSRRYPRPFKPKLALSQGIGNIFSVDEDLLGATVLAWGETFPDLMAMIAVARAGVLRHPSRVLQSSLHVQRTTNQHSGPSSQ